MAKLLFNFFGELIRIKAAENISSVAIVYGVIIAIGHVVYFWAAWLFDFLHITELRVLNVLIQGTGIYFALKQYRKTHEGSLNYFRAMSVGFFASAVGTLIFAVVLFFIFQLDHAHFQSVIRDEPMGRYLTVYMASLVILTEGARSCAFATYLLMNWLGTDRV